MKADVWLGLVRLPPVRVAFSASSVRARLPKGKVPEDSSCSYTFGLAWLRARWRNTSVTRSIMITRGALGLGLVWGMFEADLRWVEGWYKPTEVYDVLGRKKKHEKRMSV